MLTINLKFFVVCFLLACCVFWAFDYAVAKKYVHAITFTILAAVFFLAAVLLVAYPHLVS